MFGFGLIITKVINIVNTKVIIFSKRSVGSITMRFDGHKKTGDRPVWCRTFLGGRVVMPFKMTLNDGALFGFFCYMTYDLTCLAVIRDFSTRLMVMVCVA